jgi:hypothetical protein
MRQGLQEHRVGEGAEIQAASSHRHHQWPAAGGQLVLHA